MVMEAFYGILIPFLGTSLGAACVFFLRKTLSDAVQRALTGFAAGVMVAASVWSLLIPAIEQSAALSRWSFFPAVLGFWAGILFLLALDHIIPHLHAKSGQAEGPKSRLQRTTMMMLAVTLHNIPEGMAVGVVYAGYLSGQAQMSEIIYATNKKNFFMLPCGVFPTNPTELLGNARLETLLTGLKKTFDYVLIDTPPLGLVIDAAVISKVCDGSVLVLAANKSSKTLAKTVSTQLKAANPNLIGVVLNKVEVRKGSYYKKKYGNYYGKQYNAYY